jgi:hypothetical protein
MSGKSVRPEFAPAASASEHPEKGKKNDLGYEGGGHDHDREKDVAYRHQGHDKTRVQRSPILNSRGAENVSGAGFPMYPRLGQGARGPFHAHT